MCYHIKTVRLGQRGIRAYKPIRSRLTLAGNVAMMGTFIGSGVAAIATAPTTLVSRVLNEQFPLGKFCRNVY
jgi:hypothetical protein